MIGAGLLARNAVAKGLNVKPWVKTSLAPGSQVVADYLAKAGLQKPLDKLGFNLVGYGCTTCIGNSGPLARGDLQGDHRQGDLVAAAVLSGNRNFEGRVNPDVRANYLASPPLVVAYALAGSMRIDLASEPLGADKEGKAVYLDDIWPTTDGNRGIRRRKTVTQKMFRRDMPTCSTATPTGTRSRSPAGHTYDWDMGSTYVQNPPYFEGMTIKPEPVTDIASARILGNLRRFDHHRPHLARPARSRRTSPAGEYLLEHQVRPVDFNQYGTRRGNHEVMMRGTFANIRIRNQMVKDATAMPSKAATPSICPSASGMPIYDAAMRYQAERRAAGGVRRQRIRHRLVARLGGQGHAAARRARGDRRELRAHPSLEPRRHGRAAAACSTKGRAGISSASRATRQ